MIKTFYNHKQVLADSKNGNFSKSPLKPKLLLAYLLNNGFDKYFEITEDFAPFEKEDFYLAHNKEYVDGFFAGDPRQASKNGLAWSPQFADSVRYTNASLYQAIRHSIKNPEQISFSPTSGFHHATPSGGQGFCTFSGQVIASVKIYRELGLSGAYLDLDGHFGNSIEDSRRFVKDLNLAIPEGLNINPSFSGKDYITDFKNKLQVLKKYLLAGKVHYLVWCHGADSHEWDDLGDQCSTEEWLECSKIFYNFVKETEKELGRKIPLTLSLFGGYRQDDYESVLSLHTADLVIGLNILQDAGLVYEAKVKPRSKSF